MKIFDKKGCSEKPGRNRGGFATIVFLTLLTIMVLLATANTMALIHLHREVKLLEQTQIKRLQSHSAAATDRLIANSNKK